MHAFCIDCSFKVYPVSTHACTANYKEFKSMKCLTLNCDEHACMSSEH